VSHREYDYRSPADTADVDFDDDSDDIAAPAQPTRKDIQLPNEPPPPPEAQPVIPRVLLLPRTDTFVDITRLPEDIRKDLQDRFRTMCNASEKRKKRYHGMQTKPQNRLNKEECIRCQFMETSKGGRRSDGYYTNGGEVNKSADDMCIERRSPCVYMVRHNGACTLCIVPLPAGLRVGKRWDELGYWVTLGDFVP
jgi:hypothetical protein